MYVLRLSATYNVDTLDNYWRRIKLIYTSFLVHVVLLLTFVSIFRNIVFANLYTSLSSIYYYIEYSAKQRLAVFLIEPISCATVLFERLTRTEYYRGCIVGSIFIRSICNSSLLPFGLSGLRLAHLRVVFHPDNRH